MTANRPIQWWAYLHTNNTFHLKRYFGRLDIDEANESPFVRAVFGPVDAINRDDADTKLRALARVQKESNHA